MNLVKWIVTLMTIGMAAALAAVWYYASSDEWFVKYPLPLKATQRVFDVGIVDANGDDQLDVYTSNHHFRQSLLIADGKGGYRDVVSEWGLDQSLEFPMAELAYVHPTLDKPGLYVYWMGSNFVVRNHKATETGPWDGVLKVNYPVKIISNKGFEVRKQDQTTRVSETVIEFTPTGDGRLILKQGGQGLPISFSLRGSIQPSQIYVGRAKVSPPRTDFSLSMKDRHAMAWADYNDDGQLDVFINRGALGGRLRAYPQEIQDRIKDELLVSRDSGRYADFAVEAGLEKKGCSGRHAQWLDFNGDGLLDLFVNCYDRANVEGAYKKQLYQQDDNKQFLDVAVKVGVGLPDEQIGSFAWIDVENDGALDFVTLQDEGLFLYRNRGGRFTAEPLAQRSSKAAEKIGHTTSNIWLFDGKLTVVDYDADGDLDIFAASRSGNMLLRNQGSTFEVVDLATIGLPSDSAMASWVDYDNDGFVDLYSFPQGLYRQGMDRSFESTGILTFPDNDQYLAALVNWFDLDNDGRPDVLLALHENPKYKRWWELSPEGRPPEHWALLAYRNVGTKNHWLQIKLSGNAGNLQGIGATVTVITADDRQIQQVGTTDGAFFSQGHYRLYFGLGQHKKADSIRVRWSDGHEQELKDVGADRLLTITRMP